MPNFGLSSEGGVGGGAEERHAHGVFSTPLSSDASLRVDPSAVPGLRRRMEAMWAASLRGGGAAGDVDRALWCAQQLRAMSTAAAGGAWWWWWKRE